MTSVTLESAQPLYRDPTRALEERLDDLLARMTLAEKAAQLGSAWVFQLADGSGLVEERAGRILADGLGQVTRVSGASSLRPEEAADLANAIQRFLVERTRLGIPAIVHEEICSGLMARGATVFPQALGVASTWDPGLAEALADDVRRQMRARGAHQGLSPVLDVCRDPRWGRTEETFGEDPHLVARMGVSFVRGLQGDDLRQGVIATAKHFVGYAASEGGLNWAPAHIAARELREVYLHPFEAAVRSAGLRSVMNGYHELDGVPCIADRTLLTGILREQWGFEGVVASDYFSIRQLIDYHELAADPADAAAMALQAGLDVELPSTDCYGAPLLKALESGLVEEEAFEAAVRRVLRAKFELGLFEQPYVEVAEVVRVSDAAPSRELARRIAGRSLVLLRNDGTLPLAAGTGSVALIGPNAHEARHLFGDYTYPAHVEALQDMQRQGQNVFSIPFPDGASIEDTHADAETVLDALRRRLGEERVRFAPGCAVDGAARDGFDEAVALAAESDVAVMVMGDKAGLTGECTSGEGRDRASLDLPGVQEDLVRAVAATGTPVVLVLVCGRPAASAWVHEHCAAVLVAWLPGQEGAGPVADALTGRLNPGGKLPISYPRSSGQIPVFYAHKPSGGRSHWKGDYVDAPSAPLYPFGHGLSYTTFALSDAAVTRDQVSWSESFGVEVTVTNTGDRAGDEVVQLYVRQPRASLTRPVLELKGFVRVELAAGAARTVAFEVPAAQVGFHGHDLSYVVEPGVLEVLVGSSSRDLVEAGSVTIVPDPSGRPPVKAFDGSITISS
ncbi:MAG TPA: glycoside hydrolase family 3 N-terminal domain-containing protein [Actinomycetes bacterium]